MTSITLAEILRQVDEKQKQLSALRPLPPATVSSLREKLTLDWTYHSNAIEGNTLTLQETKVVIEDGITIAQKSLREHFEAINHRDAIDFVHDLVSDAAQITAWNIRNLHRLVLKNIDDSKAGKYRNCNVTISGASHIPPSHLHLQERMDELERWYQTEAKALHPVDRAAQLHTRFVEIHPFEDGNGRTARLLLNLELMRHGYPVAVIRREDRLAYYEALDQSCVQRDHTGFTRMVAECIIKSQDLYLALVAKEKSNEIDAP